MRAIYDVIHNQITLKIDGSELVNRSDQEILEQIRQAVLEAGKEENENKWVIS